MRNPKEKLASLKYRFHRDLAGKVEAPRSLVTAANFTGHDLKDPAQRDLLLFTLAEAVFGKDRVGRPRGRHGDSGGWSVSKLDRLGQLYDMYRKKGLRGDTKIAKVIHAEHKKEFGTSADAIRRWLPEARWTHEELREKHRDDDPPEGWEEAQEDDDWGKDDK
jgi:hypothetical protein